MSRVMISSFPCSSVTENATCTGSSGEFCLVKWTSFTFRVSCSCACNGISLSGPWLGTDGDSRKQPECTQPQIQSTQQKIVDIEGCDSKQKRYHQIVSSKARLPQ